MYQRCVLVDVFFLFGALHVLPTDFKVGHIAQMLALGFDWIVEKPYYRIKTPLVVGETRTQVLADSMTIAANALNHCTT